MPFTEDGKESPGFGIDPPIKEDLMKSDGPGDD